MVSAKGASRGRCLMFYPWTLEERIGALALLLSYSRAMQALGFRIDCFAPRGAGSEANLNGLVYGVFERVYTPPPPHKILAPVLDLAASLHEDDHLPDKTGRDPVAMVSAAVLASVSSYDVVGVHYTRCHSIRQMLPPGLPAILFTHELDSLVAKQERTVYGFASSYSLADEADRMRPFELTTVVGPHDAGILQEAEPDLPIVEAPFTAEKARRVSVRERSSGTLLWLSCAGLFHELSFQWFWEHVWPRVRRKKPGCRLAVGGRISHLAEKLGADRDKQVRVLGVVGDPEPLYRETDVLLAPYYYGLGIKTKIIDALNRGLPVVTTSVGLFNTRITPGREALVSDEASEYAEHIVSLLSSAAQRKELASAGFRYIRRWHDPRTAYEPLKKAVLGILDKPAAREGPRLVSQRQLYEPLRHLIPWAIQRCRADGVERVAFFGAGGHTRILLPIWRASRGPQVTAILVSGEPESSEFMGLPVYPAGTFDASQIGGIVLSSHGYEEAMAATCRRHWPDLKIYPVWRPLPSDFARRDAAAAPFLCEERVPSGILEF